MLAALGAAGLTPLFRAVAAQELTKSQQETFAGAKGLVYRRLDVKVSGLPYAYEDTEQHALLDWFRIVDPDEAKATATYEGWADEIGPLQPEPATWLFPKLEYEHTRTYRIAGPHVAEQDRFLHGAWHLTAGDNRTIVGHIFLGQRGTVVIAGEVMPGEGSEDVHIPMISALLGGIFIEHTMLDVPLLAPEEVIDEARLLTLSPHLPS
jgi:hypothetical protein